MTDNVITDNCRKLYYFFTVWKTSIDDKIYFQFVFFLSFFFHIICCGFFQPCVSKLQLLYKQQQKYCILYCILKVVSPGFHQPCYLNLKNKYKNNSVKITSQSFQEVYISYLITLTLFFQCLSVRHAIKLSTLLPCFSIVNNDNWIEKRLYLYLIFICYGYL